MKMINIAFLTVLAMGVATAAPRDVDYLSKDNWRKLQQMYKTDPDLFWKVFNWILIEDREFLARNRWYTERLIEGYELGAFDLNEIFGPNDEIDPYEYYENAKIQDIQ